MRCIYIILAVAMLLFFFFIQPSAGFCSISGMDEFSLINDLPIRNTEFSRFLLSYSNISHEYLIIKDILNENLLFSYDNKSSQYLACNRESGISLAGDKSGLVIINTSYGSFSLCLCEMGRISHTSIPDFPKAGISGQTLVFSHSGYSEWYKNTNSGIEHGMIIFDKPEGDGNLLAGFQLSGDFFLALNGDNIYLLNENGCICEYSGMYAFDLTGKKLPSRLFIEENKIFWEIDDSSAVYPVYVDPSLKEVHTEYGEKNNDYLGYSVSVSGNYSAACVNGYGNSSSGDNGAVCFYELDSNGLWVSKDIKTGLAVGDKFGNSLSVSGKYAVIGADCNSSGGHTDAGAAYFYERNENGYWILKDIKTGVAANDNFGNSVSLSGDYAVIGAPDRGAYFYEHDGSGGWVLKETKSASNAIYYYGNSVSVSGNLAVVGARGNLSSPGAVYFYEHKSSGNWSLKDIKYGFSAYDWFGNSVHISGSNALVGACMNLSAQGTVYFYQCNEYGNWILKDAKSGAKASDHFGCSVSLSGNNAIIGAYYGLSNTGAAYFYESIENGSWILKDVKSGVSANDQFGHSVSISNDNALVGAPYSLNGNGTVKFYKLNYNASYDSLNPSYAVNSGLVSVEINGSDFYETASVKPVVKLSKTGESDIFATSVFVKNSRQIDCTFDITGSKAGVWNLFIINPDGKSAEGKDAFEIKSAESSGGAPLSDNLPSDGGFNKDTGVGTSYNINSGESSTFIFVDKGAVYELSLAAKNVIPKLMVTVKKQGYLPSSINPPEKEVYEYEEVTLYYADKSEISGCSFKFRVGKNWMDSHGYESCDITMIYYNKEEGRWHSAETVYLGEYGGYYSYSANAPLFSWFAIAADNENKVLSDNFNSIASTTAEQDALTDSKDTLNEVSKSGLDSEFFVIHESDIISEDDSAKSQPDKPFIVPLIISSFAILLTAAVVLGKKKEEYPDWWDKKF